jgi:hypothetical protein
MGPALRHVPGNNEIRADQTTAWSGETSQEGHRNAKGWIRDDTKWSTRQPHVGPVSLHHCDLVHRELPAKIVRSSWV